MSSNIPLARDIIRQVAADLCHEPELQDQLSVALDLMRRSKPDFVSPKKRPTPTPAQRAEILRLRDLGYSYDDIEKAIPGVQRGRISETVNPR